METAVKEDLRKVWAESSFSKDLAKMTKEQIIQFANEKLGVTVDNSLSKDKMIKALVELKKAQDKAAIEQTEAETKKAATPDDPPVSIIFTNAEFPGADLQFTYEHHQYHLFHGKVHKLPVSVVDHLNDLKVNDDKYDTDPKTGQIIGITKAVRYRFRCMPTELGKLIRQAQEIR